MKPCPGSSELSPQSTATARVPEFHRFFVDLSTDHIEYLLRKTREWRLTAPSSALRIILEHAIERGEI